MTPDPALVQDAEDQGFADLLRMMWDKRWWLIVAVVGTSIVLTVAALTMTPVYRSTSVLVPASAERDSSLLGGSGGLGQLGGLASLAGINLKSGDIETEQSLAILRSRQFTEAFIVQRQLLPKLFPKQWDAAAGKWKTDKKPPTLAKGYEYFDKRVRTIVQDKKTGLLKLEIVWKDPEEAARWANELIDQLNRETRGRAIAKADASLGYLRSELEKTSITEVREAINRLIEVQIKQRMLANVTSEYAFRIVDKALPADKDDPIRPKKAMMIVGGPVLGGFLGVMAILIAASVRREQVRHRSQPA